MSEYSKRVIDKKQILKNLEEIKLITGKDKKICAMVKADAYGHGLENVVEMLKYHVDFLGVATIKEALVVRGIDKNINVLVVGKTCCFKKCIENNIDFTIDSVSQMQQLAVYCSKKDLPSNVCINIHIKINTGMNRLGIKSIDDFKKIYELAEENNANVVGVFTHFATADCDQQFYERQKICFLKYLREIPKRENPIIHIGGSGVLAYPLNFNFDMVRVGIVLYGYNAEHISKKIKPVMKLVSKIVKIIDVSKGEFVGYSKGFMAKQDMRVGVIPLGYADGISRGLSNKGFVFIKGRKYNIIGNICMDMFMVDISSGEVNEFDEVIVVKNVKKWSSILKTIPYEILTNFSHMR